MKNGIKYLKKSWPYLKRYKKSLIFICTFGILFASISALIPLISARLVTNMTENVIEQIFILAIILLLIRTCSVLINYFLDKVYFILTGKIIYDIRKDMVAAILSLEAKNFDQTSSGVFVKRLEEDPFEIAWMFNSLRNTLTNILTNLGIFVLIFMVNIYIGIFLCLSLIIVYIVQKKRILFRNFVWKKYKELDDMNSGIFQEILKGVRDIKVLGLKKPFTDYSLSALNTSYEKKKEVDVKNTFYWSLDNAVKALIECGFLFLGILLVMKSQLKPTDFVILYMYKDQLFNLTLFLSNLVGDLNDFEIAAKRVFEVLDYSSYTKEKFGNKKIKRIIGNIEFKDVTFGYEDEMTVLNEFNLEIKANDTVAIVGKSGEGKSTLFSLLSRLYDTKKGSITIDGVSIYDLDEETLRNNISIITQNPYIFNMSIRENLMLVKPDMSEEEMVAKCRLACLDEYIETLPQKYDTIIGEGGINLSGGQKQRLAIARALIKDSEIILFDEATSALDNETQKSIQKSIQNISKDYTILIIAHRLSTIKFCNKIVVLKDGKVTGIGNHEQLLNQNQTYKELYKGNLE